MNELQLRAEEVSSINISLWSNIPIWFWLVATVIILMSILSSWDFIIEGVFVTMLATAVLFVIAIIFFAEDEPNPEYDKWVNDAHEFIESLPTEEYEIVYIKIDPEMASKTSGSFFLGSGTVHTSIERSTPVSIAYKDGEEILIKTLWADTSMSLSEDETPYVTFKNLSEDLGHKIEAGWYNPVVHLPKNYQFTDIK